MKIHPKVSRALDEISVPYTVVWGKDHAFALIGPRRIIVAWSGSSKTDVRIKDAVRKLGKIKRELGNATR